MSMFIELDIAFILFIGKEINNIEHLYVKSTREISNPTTL